MIIKREVVLLNTGYIFLSLLFIIYIILIISKLYIEKVSIYNLLLLL